MYYQYGYFKPLVARKVGRVMTVRQLVPSILIATLLGPAVLSIWVPGLGAVSAAVAATYASLVVGCASMAAGRDLRSGLALAAVFPILHFSYGFGFLRGIYDHLLARGLPKAGEIGLSR